MELKDRVEERVSTYFEELIYLLHFVEKEQSHIRMDMLVDFQKDFSQVFKESRDK